MKTLILFSAAFLFSVFVSAKGNTNESSELGSSGIGLSEYNKANEDSRLGEKHLTSGDYKTALEYFNRSSEIFLRLDSIQKYISDLEQIGVCYGELGMYEKSHEFLFKALELAEQNSGRKWVGSILLNIGTTFLSASDLNGALKYFTKASREVLDHSDQFALYTNTGTLYRSLNISDSALFFYNQALELQGKYNVGSPGSVYVNLSGVYYSNREYDTSFQYLKMATSSFRQVKDMKGYWHSMYNLNLIFHIKGQPDSALAILDSCIEYFISTNDIVYLSDCYKQYSRILEEMNRPGEAILYLKKHNVMKDSIMNSNVLSNIASIQMKYEVEKLEQKKEAELSLMEKDKLISNYRWAVITGVLILLLILVLIVIGRIRSKKKITEIQLENAMLLEEKLKNELEYKNSELQSFALNIIHRNEFLTSIYESLRKIKSKLDREHASELALLISQIRQMLTVSSEVETFQKKVEKVNYDFFCKLEKLHPDLTENEKRLCVLLRLNLSSKEIASLNNISEGAVTMARYRLRKKLNLDKDENLADLIQKY